MTELTVNNMKLSDMILRRTMGDMTILFLTVEDLGSQGKGFNPPHFKNYYGPVSTPGYIEPTTDQIKSVMLNGDKWDLKNGKIVVI